MQIVIFEVVIKDGKHNEYLDIAAKLRPLLEKVDGFISVERFQSLNDPKKLLSLSFWRDSAAVARWRTQSQHMDAQSKGNTDVFSDYKITVANAIRSYGMTERTQAPD